jgi:kynurenine formamidase
MNNKRNFRGIVAVVTLLALITVGVLSVQAASPSENQFASRPAFGHSGSEGTKTPEVKDNKFEFKGVVMSMDVASWLIEQQVVTITADTYINTGIKLGDTVEVKGVILNGTTYQAEKIKLEDVDNEEVDNEFELKGIVISMDAASWLVDQQVVSITADTVIESGIKLGDTVEVEGVILNGTTYQAEKIKLEDNDGGSGYPAPTAEFKPSQGKAVEITGTITQINPGELVIDGRRVKLSASIDKKLTFQLGQFVTVHALIQTDGTYLAHAIKFLDVKNGSAMSSHKSGSGKDDK